MLVNIGNMRLMDLGLVHIERKSSVLLDLVHTEKKRLSVFRFGSY